jgi:hypothetical protein
MADTMLTLEQVRRKGLELLFRGLGPDDAIRFLQLYDNGKGNYTEERHTWLTYKTVDEVMEDLKRMHESSP